MSISSFSQNGKEQYNGVNTVKTVKTEGKIMEYIKIDKSLCKDNNNKFYPKVIVELPEQSSFAGYYFELSNIVVRTNYNQICKPYKSDFVFKLIKQEREPGQRYSRPALSWEALCREFEEHQKQFDKSSLPKALAYVNDYNYRNGIEWSRAGNFVIGAIEGAWFWKDEDDKRRVSAKNFKLIAFLPEEEALVVSKKIERLEEIVSKLYSITSSNNIKDQIDSFLQYGIKKLPELQVQAELMKSSIIALEESLKKEATDIMDSLWNLQQPSLQ